MMSTLRVRHHAARRRLVGAGRGPVPGETSRWLRAGLEAYEPTGDGVWLVRRLEVGAVVVPDNAVLAGQRLAAAVARAVDDVVAAGPHPPDVLWYPDRAAYVAQWVLDVVHERARGRWEYHGLPQGPPASALRDLAEAEPSVLLRAWSSLAPARLDEVVARLDPVGAADVTRAVSTGSVTVAVRDLAGVVRGLVEAGRLPPDTHRATLTVVLTLAAGGAVSQETVARAHDLVVVAGELAGRSASDRAALARALTGGDWRAAARAGASGAVAVLASWDPEVRRSALDGLAPATPAGSPDPGVEHYGSRFGGILLLLPLLAEIPLRAATAGWPPLGEVPPDRLVAAVAIACVHGSASAGAVLADPALRLGLGLDDVAEDDLATWAHQVTAAQHAAFRAAFEPVLSRRAPSIDTDLADPGLLPTGIVGARCAATVRIAAAALLRELACRLPGMAAASVDHLRRNVLAFDATVQVAADDEPVVVLLGSPPLGLLLNLTGMDRCRFRLSATGEREWVLTRRG